MKPIRTIGFAIFCLLPLELMASGVTPYPPETYDGPSDNVHSNPVDACQEWLQPDIDRSYLTVKGGTCSDGSVWRTETGWDWKFTGIQVWGNPKLKAFSCMLRTVGTLNMYNHNCSGTDVIDPYFSETERVRVGANVCPPGEVWSPKRFLPRNGGRHYLCLPIKPKYSTSSCTTENGYGNPIVPAAGAKSLKLKFNAFGLLASYDTRAMVRSEVTSTQWMDTVKGGLLMPYHAQPSESFGLLWQSNHHKKLVTSVTNPVLVDGEQVWRAFTATDSSRTKFISSDGVYKLTRTEDWSWILNKPNSDALVFSNDGKLKKQVAGGVAYSYEYSTSATPINVAPVEGLLLTITDQHGRVMNFSYRLLTLGRIGIASIHFNNELLAELGYTDAGFLNSVLWPDNNKLTYLYEEADKPWAVTGQLDESSVRLATYTYDNFGRANSTMLAGGADKYEAEWNEQPKPYVLDEYFDTYVERTFIYQPQIFRVKTPLGIVSESETVSFGSQAVLVSQSQPGGSGCSASSMSREHDSRGNITSLLDFSGRRTCSGYDASRNLQITRLEGLYEADSCPTDVASYAIPAGLAPDKAQRKTSTQWHPVWHLKTREAEPKRITTWVYNGQPDPLNNNVEASCAPADAVLPDGSKIAVLCKRYEQATADETGNLGFAAAVLSTRSWSSTYNQHGQVLSETDPRQKKTCHQYWGDTAFEADGRGHTLGDLWRTSQMAGANQDCTPANMAAQAHKTTHTHYNKRGQVLRTELPNGGVEEREYHLRGWLTKVKQRATATATASLDTQYEYYPTGLLKLVTQADGSWQRYEYDDAHRLTDVIDSLGNKVHYTLDNAGNATQESHTDPSGVLVKAISRTYDTLGRLQSQKLGAP